MGHCYNKLDPEPDLTSPSVYEWTLFFEDEEGVEGKHIKAESIDANHIRTGAIEAGHILAGEVKADHIHGGAISTDKLDTQALNLTGSGMAITMAPQGSDPVFHVDADGYMTANKGTFSGAVQGGVLKIPENADTKNGCYIDGQGNFYAQSGEFRGRIIADEIVGDLVSAGTAPNNRQLIWKSWVTVFTIEAVNNNTQPATAVINTPQFYTNGGRKGGQNLNLTIILRLEESISGGDFNPIEEVSFHHASPQGSHHSGFCYGLGMVPIANIPVNQKRSWRVRAVISNESGVELGKFTNHCIPSRTSATLFRDGNAFS